MMLRPGHRPGLVGALAGAGPVPWGCPGAVGRSAVALLASVVRVVVALASL